MGQTPEGGPIIQQWIEDIPLVDEKAHIQHFSSKTGPPNACWCEAQIDIRELSVFAYAEDIPIGIMEEALALELGHPKFVRVHVHHYNYMERGECVVPDGLSCTEPLK